MVAGNIKVHVNEGKYKTAANSDYNSFTKILRIFNVQLDIVALYIVALYIVALYIVALYIVALYIVARN